MKPKYFNEMILIDQALNNLQGQARQDFVNDVFEKVYQKGRQEMRDEITDIFSKQMHWSFAGIVKVLAKLGDKK